MAELKEIFLLKAPVVKQGGSINGTPIAGWFIVENPILDDLKSKKKYYLGVCTPVSGNLHIPTSNMTLGFLLHLYRVMGPNFQRTMIHATNYPNKPNQFLNVIVKIQVSPRL